MAGVGDGWHPSTSPPKHGQQQGQRGFASARKVAGCWEFGTPETTQSSGWVISDTTSGLVGLWSFLPPAIDVEVGALKLVTALASNGSCMV